MLPYTLCFTQQVTASRHLLPQRLPLITTSKVAPLACTLVQPLWRTVWKFLRKPKIELPYDPATPLLGIYLEKTLIGKDTCTPMSIAALFTTAKTWKQPKCSSTDAWIQKVWHIYIYIYIYIHIHTHTHTHTHTQWNTTRP